MLACSIAILILFLAVPGCVRKESPESTAKKVELARQDSLLAVIQSAGDRSRPARIINPAAATRTSKFSSFSDSALQSVQKTAVRVKGKPKIATANSDTASTLESAIATNAAAIKVDSGSAEDRKLDSLMLIANTLSNRYQQMVMTHTHRNLAEAAHQNPAKTRRLLKNIMESAPERLSQSKKINEIRQQRLQSLQSQMQLQLQRQQQTGGFIGDSGK